MYVYTYTSVGVARSRSIVIGQARQKVPVGTMGMDVGWAEVDGFEIFLWR